MTNYLFILYTYWNSLIFGVSSGVRSNGNQAHGGSRHSDVTDVISLTSAGTVKVVYLQTCMCEDSGKKSIF